MTADANTPNLTPEGQRLADALDVILHVTDIPQHKREDAEFLRGVVCCARDYARAASQELPAALLLTAPEGEGAGLREADARNWSVASSFPHTAESSAAWMDSAAMFSRNADFYRGIVVQIGEMFGDAAKTSDDGSLQHSVLALKVPGLVAAALAKTAPMGEDETGVREAWSLTGVSSSGFGWSNSEWFRASDGERKSFPIGFNPNTGVYENFNFVSNAAPQPPKAEAPPTPADVYYARGNFYHMDTQCGMGNDFYHLWRSRSGEFPSMPQPKAETPAGVAGGAPVSPLLASCMPPLPDGLVYVRTPDDKFTVQQKPVSTNYTMTAALSAAPAARPRDEVSGFVLVPREPTPAMNRAGAQTFGGQGDNADARYECAVMYRAMLAAVPAADGGLA